MQSIYTFSQTSTFIFSVVRFALILRKVISKSISLNRVHCYGSVAMFAVRPLLSRCIRTEFSFLIKMAHMVLLCPGINRQCGRNEIVRDIKTKHVGYKDCWEILCNCHFHESLKAGHDIQTMAMKTSGWLNFVCLKVVAPVDLRQKQLSCQYDYDTTRWVNVK